MGAQPVLVPLVFAAMLDLGLYETTSLVNPAAVIVGPIHSAVDAGLAPGVEPQLLTH